MLARAPHNSLFIDLWQMGTNGLKQSQVILASGSRSEEQPDWKATVTRNVTFTGFHTGVSLGDPGKRHPVVVAKLLLTRNHFGVYTNSNVVTVCHDRIVANANGAMYLGSKN
jgi:hypothetical protein